MPPNDYQQQLNDLVALVGKLRERECPEYPYHNDAYPESHLTEAIVKRLDAECATCKEIAQSQAAWIAMTREYPNGDWGTAPQSSKRCILCWGNKRIPHDISTWPLGAVRGMLMEAAYKMDMEGAIRSNTDVEYMWQLSPEALFTAFKEALEQRVESERNG